MQRQKLWRRASANQPVTLCLSPWSLHLWWPSAALRKAENLSSKALAPQNLHPKALPLQGLTPAWPLPGSRTWGTCFSPQIGRFPFNLVFLLCFPKPLSFSQTLSSPWASGFRKIEARIFLLLILSFTSLTQVTWSWLAAQVGNKKGKLQTTPTQGRHVCFRSETGKAEKKAILLRQGWEERHQGMTKA